MENSSIYIHATKNGVKLTFHSYFKEITNNRMRVIALDKKTIYTSVMLINGTDLICATDLDEGDELYHFENDIKSLAESIGAYNEVNDLIAYAKKTRADLINKAEA